MKHKWFSLLLLLLGAVGVPSCARAEVPKLLQAALDTLMAEEDHWAFTTTIHDRTGKSGDTIERYDPSLPPEKQWTLVQWKGKAPSESFSRRWQKRKVKEQEKQEGEDSLGDLMLADKATVFSRGDGKTVFQVPLRKGNHSKLPSEAFTLLFTIDEAGAVTRIELASHKDFRVAAIAKIKDFKMCVRFAQVDPAHPPALCGASVGVKGKAFGLMKINEEQEIVMSGHRRVKPYKDRFTVEIGKVKALNF